MEKPQLRKPSCFKSVSSVRTCLESLSRNFADSLAKSFQSLTLTSWSLPIDSLTLHSLSLTKGNSDSLTLQSLSLIAENRLQRISFKEVIFGDESFKETAENLEHSLAKGGAGTNSFSTSFLDRIVSLSKRFQIFLLSSFQLTCAAFASWNLFCLTELSQSELTVS